MKVLTRSSEVGGRTLLVRAASAGPEPPGQYLSDARIEKPPNLLLTKKGAEMRRCVWVEMVEKLEDVEAGILNEL